LNLYDRCWNRILRVSFLVRFWLFLFVCIGSGTVTFSQPLESVERCLSFVSWGSVKNGFNFFDVVEVFWDILLRWVAGWVGDGKNVGGSMVLDISDFAKYLSRFRTALGACCRSSDCSGGCCGREFRSGDELESGGCRGPIRKLDCGW
jgi:hypothetical protein